MWNTYINSSKWFISNKKIDANSNIDIIDSYNFNIEEPDASQKVIEVKEDPKSKTPKKKLYKKRGMISDNLHILYDITYGHPKRIYSAIIYTILANFVGFVPFGLTITVVQTVFEVFDGSGHPLNKTRIWIISGVLLVFIFFIYLSQVPAFNKSYTKAYKASVTGRMELIEHIHRLPIGTLYSKDLGEMVSLIMNDFLLIESCSSHMVPQLFGALVIPVISFISLLFYDWRLDLAAFLPFPIGLFVILLA